jgi:predicted enzyme related to lactoylglutathione lyase
MPAPNLDYILLFVSDPMKSSSFYTKLFDVKPVEESATFALFAFPNGIMLGLWSPLTAEPPAVVTAGGCEIAFSNDNVDAIHDAWHKKGIPIVQKPTDMDFGRTFVALDPDGHRIRVFKVHS